MKWHIAILLFFTLSVDAFSDSETLLSFGGQYSILTESSITASGSDTSSRMNSIGLILDSYTFWNKSNIGFFAHDSFFFPQTGSVTANGSTVRADYSIYDFLMGIGLIFGPGIRYPINNKTSILGGIGPSMVQITGNYSTYDDDWGSINYSIFGWVFGIGADMGFKVDLTDKFFIKLGSSLIYNFACITIITLNGLSESGWADGYSGFFIRPYISIGLNTYRQSGIGKL